MKRKDSILSNYYFQKLPKAKMGLQSHDCPEGFLWNEERQTCTTPDGQTLEELKADNDAKWNNFKTAAKWIGGAGLTGYGAYALKGHPLVATIPDVIRYKQFSPYAQALAMQLLQKGSYPFAKLPLTRDIYKAAAQRIGSQSAVGDRDFKDVIQGIFNNKKGSYSGFNIERNKLMQDFGARNALNNYLYEDATGYEESDIPYRNLENYEKQYGKKFKTYKLALNNPNQPIHIDNFLDAFLFAENKDGTLKYPELHYPGITDFEQKKFIYDLIKKNGIISRGEYKNVLGPDNIAGHMQYWEHDPKTGGISLTSQDLWKFSPEQYGKRWLNWYGDDYSKYSVDFNKHKFRRRGTFTKNFLDKFARYKQVQLMDRAGTPFVLIDKSPIDFGPDFPLDLSLLNDTKSSNEKSADQVASTASSSTTTKNASTNKPTAKKVESLEEQLLNLAKEGKLEKAKPAGTNKGTVRYNTESSQTKPKEAKEVKEVKAEDIKIEPVEVPGIWEGLKTFGKGAVELLKSGKLKLEYGGPLQAFYQGKMTGSNMFPDGGQSGPGDGPGDPFTQEELNKNYAQAREWLTNWYEGRKSIPEFKKISKDRLWSLNSKSFAPMKNISSEEMVSRNYDITPAAFYNNNKIYVVDPNDPKSLQNPDEARVNASVPVLTHELRHALGYRPVHGGKTWAINTEFKNQKIGPLAGKEESSIEPSIYDWITRKDEAHFRSPDEPWWSNLPFVAAFRPEKMVTKDVYSEMDAVLDMFRQKEKLDPKKVYTVEEMKPIIDKYMNAPIPQGDNMNVDEHQTWLIRQMIKALKNNPKAITDYHNSTAANKTTRNMSAAKYGGMPIYDDGGEPCPEGQIKVNGKCMSIFSAEYLAAHKEGLIASPSGDGYITKNYDEIQRQIKLMKNWKNQRAPSTKGKAVNEPIKYVSK